MRDEFWILFRITFEYTIACIVYLEETAQLSKTFMEIPRGLLSKLLPLANGVRKTDAKNVLE